MTTHPAPGEIRLLFGDHRVERCAQIVVGLAFPALSHGEDHLLTVAHDFDANTGLLEYSQTFDDGGEFHAVVRGALCCAR